MYADDTTIYFNLEEANLVNNITNELDKVNVWLKQNKLSLNSNKN